MIKEKSRKQKFLRKVHQDKMKVKIKIKIRRILESIALKRNNIIRGMNKNNLNNTRKSRRLFLLVNRKK
jgi:hypothetical protein